MASPATPAIGRMDQGSVDRARLEREMARMSADELQHEIREAMRRTLADGPPRETVRKFVEMEKANERVLRHETVDGGVSTSDPRARTTCSVCASTLSSPIFSCSLRHHPHCLNCVVTLGGKHKCTKCVPTASYASTSTAHSRGVFESSDALAPMSPLNTTAREPQNEPAASIESYVDPTRRDLRREARIAARP